MTQTRTTHERLLTNGLLRLSRTYRREVDKMLAARGLSEARALAVLQIARLGDGVRQGVLAEQLGVEGPSLVRTLDQLCASGLVERRGDPNDKRARGLYLTGEGHAQAAVVETILDVYRHQLLAQIDDAALASVLTLFDQLEAALSATRPSE